MLSALLNEEKKKEEQKSAAAEKVVVEIDASKIPCLDEHSLQHFKRIIKNDKKLLEFVDNLTIYSLSGAETGRFHVQVVPTIYRNQSCFKVHAKSTGTLEDVPCGTEINAYVNEKLETIEQDYFEFVKLPHSKLERKTLLLLDEENDDVYTITSTETSQGEIKTSTFKIKRTLMIGYVSESSNLLLQRLMIQNSLLDTFSLFTFDKDINPCFVTYKPLDKRRLRIDDEEIQVVGLERTIESLSDLPITWQIYFTADGHMVNRVQVGYPAVIKVSTKPGPIQVDEYLAKPIVEKKELEWERDMELKSKYLDRVEETKNDYDQYMHDHPDLRAMMADYMQSVLSVKPADVLTFSARHFASYSSKTDSNRLYPTLKQTCYIPIHNKQQHNHHDNDQQKH